MTDETESLRKALHSRAVAAVVADFELGGAEAVKRLREKDPSAYMRTVLAIAAETSTDNAWSEFNDAELSAARTILENAIRARTNADGGAGEAPKPEPLGRLSPLPETEAVS